MHEVDFIFVHTNHGNTRVAGRFETRPTGYVASLLDLW